MRQFQVPQFIEVEDKIFGPLTLKQFMYILGGGAIIFFLWYFLAFWLFFILAIPVGAFFGSLAFLQVNGRPFIVVLSSALGYYSGTRLFLWKKQKRVKKTEEDIPQQKEEFTLPKLTEGKLKDLAWSLDINKELKR